VDFYLERRDGFSAVPTYNWRNVPERSCANDDVICVIRDDDHVRKRRQKHTNRTAYFSVGGRPPARILGLGWTEDCNSWDGMITIILICA
jgi:hypothetical protein